MTYSLFRDITSSDNSGPVIVVEMSGNHQSDLVSAKEFVKRAIVAGADIIKFQVYTPDTITLNSKKKDFRVQSGTIWEDHNTLYELYTLAHTPWAWVSELARLCETMGQPWFASPFDASAVAFLESINCPAYKLASPEISDINLVEVIAKTRKPLILSTGLTDQEELDQTITTIKKHHNSVAILKCTSAYPAPLEDLNLKAIPYLRDRYNCPIGYSDHSEGELAAIAAVALGATIIEKHFKLDNDNTSVDAKFSMELSKLSSFKQKLQNVYSILGTATLQMPASVEPSLTGRRSLYVAETIKVGDVFTADNIKSVRPSFGLSPKYLSKIIGRRSTKELELGDRLTLDAIEDVDQILD